MLFSVLPFQVISFVFRIPNLLFCVLYIVIPAFHILPQPQLVVVVDTLYKCICSVCNIEQYEDLLDIHRYRKTRDQVPMPLFFSIFHVPNVKIIYEYLLTKKLVPGVSLFQSDDLYSCILFLRSTSLMISS